MVTPKVLLLTSVTAATLSPMVTCCHMASLTSTPIFTGNMEPSSMIASPTEADVASDPAISFLLSDLEGQICTWLG